ncbi:unnamed protein product [Arabis nemorensis]|uniref:Uncharacterized protein n=1 Tax=Arabis nemorensis TaxID=586526 RepID=A0A565CMY7_9BRAS|nr:unnamed protein product [Arabis nemorensis]
MAEGIPPCRADLAKYISTHLELRGLSPIGKTGTTPLKRIRPLLKGETDMAVYMEKEHPTTGHKQEDRMSEIL